MQILMKLVVDNTQIIAYNELNKTKEDAPQEHFTARGRSSGGGVAKGEKGDKNEKNKKGHRSRNRT